MTTLASIVVLLTLSYTLALFATSRRRPRRPPAAPEDLHFVFMIPCLNEELVIGKTIEALLEVAGNNFSIMVIDDGSEDGTADVVRSFDPERVWLFQRVKPYAQQGKGEALNAAYRHLLNSEILGGRDPHKVVTVIVDADGRIQRNALVEVGPYFALEDAGAVQIGVRMNNVSNLLTRAQDFEFVTFTEIFQRGRELVGSVGLGGNGQFTRLSALASLGHAPWTDCLTKDLDLGLQLLVKGWRNFFCPTTHVSQQGVAEFKRLVRQRSRWFQGHMQCWKRIPMVVTSDLPKKTIADLTYHLMGPGLVLIFTFPIIAFVISLTWATVEAPGDLWAGLTANNGLLLFVWYLLSFGLAPFYGFVYWMREEHKSLLGSIAIAHYFSMYSYMWFIAGWMATYRIVFKKRGWAKTTRTAERVV